MADEWWQSVLEAAGLANPVTFGPSVAYQSYRASQAGDEATAAATAGQADAAAIAAQGQGSAPAAGATSDAPSYLGFESYPGFDPDDPAMVPNVRLPGGEKGAQPGSVRYTTTSPLTAWNGMDGKTALATKQRLWQAGFYGKTMPVMSASVVTEADVKAMTAAMTEANLSGLGDYNLALSAREALPEAADPEARQKRVALKSAYDGAVLGLRQFAYQNGVELSGDFVKRKAAQIAKGDTDSTTVEKHLRSNFVARAYPAFKDQVLAGENIRDLAQPWTSTVASLLEIPESKVDLSDPLVKSALQGVDAKGNAGAEPLWAFEKRVKADPRWASTDNAWDEIGSQAFDVMKMFGFQA